MFRTLTFIAGLAAGSGHSDGAADRRDFGADGYPVYVGPMIALRIVARIER